MYSYVLYAKTNSKTKRVTSFDLAIRKIYTSNQKGSKKRLYNGLRLEQKIKIKNNFSFSAFFRTFTELFRILC